MSNFTKNITRTYDFEDDQVKITMKRLKRKDAIKIIPYIGEPDADGKVTMNLSDSMEFLNVAANLLMKYIKSFEGLKDEDGTQLNIDQVFGPDAESYFISLASEVMGDLIEASFVKPKDEKKSEELHKNISADSVTTQEEVSK